MKLEKLNRHLIPARLVSIALANHQNININYKNKFIYLVTPQEENSPGRKPLYLNTFENEIF